MKLICMLTLLVVTAASAHAHAFLDHAEPKVGATLTTAPACVKIWFTEDVKDGQSRIAVYDIKGAEIDSKDSKRTPDNHAAMVVTLPHLSTGTYQVVWTAVCKLGHHTSGHFSFTIAGSG